MMRLNIDDEFLEDPSRFNFGYVCTQVYNKNPASGLYPNVYMCDDISSADSDRKTHVQYFIKYDDLCEFQSKHSGTIYLGDKIHRCANT